MKTWGNQRGFEVSECWKHEISKIRNMRRKREFIEVEEGEETNKPTTSFASFHLLPQTWIWTVWFKSLPFHLTVKDFWRKSHNDLMSANPIEAAGVPQKVLVYLMLVNQERTFF